MEVRLSNMTAAKGHFYLSKSSDLPKSDIIQAISDAVRTSLGPKGMDKMVCGILCMTRQGSENLCRYLHRKEKLL